MQHTDKTYLLERALDGRSISIWNFLNLRRCDEQLKFLAAEGLSRVQAKTLVINGRTDGICSEAAARKVAEELGSKAKLVLIEAAGHVPWLEKPDEFFVAVKRFLGDS
jgi:pimeloyl-ACP methyl ester carboxylesterase